MKNINKNYIIVIICIIIFSVLSNVIPKKRNIIKENNNYIRNPHLISGKSILRIAVPKTENPLNPFFDEDNNISVIKNLIHPSLFSRDKNNRIVKDIVKDYWYEDNGQTIAVILKDGIKFSDNRELTSNDVKETFSLLADPKYEGNFSSYVDNIQGYYDYKLEKNQDFRGIEIINSKFLKFHFESVDFSNIKNLEFPIVDLSKIDYDYADLDKVLKAEFISGAGNYEVESKKDNKILLRLKKGSTLKTNLKKIEFIYLDGEDAIKEYKKGNVDIVYKFSDNKNIFNVFDNRTIEYSYRINHESSYYYFLGFNQNGKLFSDEKFRRALRDTLDIEDIVESKFPNDRYDFPKIPVYENSWFNREEIKIKKEDNLEKTIEKNKESLKDILSRNGKIKLKLIALQDDEFFKEISKEFKNQIENKFIDLDIEYLSSQEMYKALDGEIDFDLFIGQRKMNDIPDHVLEERYPVEREYNLLNQAENNFFYVLENIGKKKKNKDIDTLISEWKENFKIITPYIVLVTENVTSIVNKRVKNLYMNEFVGLEYIDNLEKIELKY